MTEGQGHNKVCKNHREGEEEEEKDRGKEGMEGVKEGGEKGKGKMEKEKLMGSRCTPDRCERKRDVMIKGGRGRERAGERSQWRGYSLLSELTHDRHRRDE